MNYVYVPVCLIMIWKCKMNNLYISHFESKLFSDIECHQIEEDRIWNRGIKPRDQSRGNELSNWWVIAKFLYL